MQTDKCDRELMDTIVKWKPKLVEQEKTIENECGFPTVIYRSPSRLIKECEDAYDCGCVIAALTLVLTIPDVCSKMDGTDYRTWSARYLQLKRAKGSKEKERAPEKTQKEVAEGFKCIESEGIFTAADLYQLRCSIVHAGSSVIGKGETKDKEETKDKDKKKDRDKKEKKDGARYSPYKTIGVGLTGNPENLLISYGHDGVGIDEMTNCSYSCTVNLEGLIRRMAKGVERFILEDPTRDDEYSFEKAESIEDKETPVTTRKGIVDYRTISN